MWYFCSHKNNFLPFLKFYPVFADIHINYICLCQVYLAQKQSCKLLSIWLTSPTSTTPTPTPRPQRSASPSFICPPSIQPLHSPTSSFTCSQIYFSLSLSPGQPTSLPPSSLSLGFSPCSVTVSSHSINQALRPGCSAARHRAVPVWSHQCQSVSLTLSVTLKRFRLPDIVCFLRPDPGQEMELSRDSA